MVRAIRGAITVDDNTPQDILNSTNQILKEIVKANSLIEEDIISILFSTTKDLDATFPAVAARQLGWADTPLMCTHEIDVPGSLEKCVRVLMHVNTEASKKQISHVYLKGATALRPDLKHCKED